jgi:hypothetical protein
MISLTKPFKFFRGIRFALEEGRHDPGRRQTTDGERRSSSQAGGVGEREHAGHLLGRADRRRRLPLPDFGPTQTDGIETFSSSQR